MRRKLLEVLACPSCGGGLGWSGTESEGEIHSGSLDCADCRRGFPIVGGIPRFVPSDSYAASFGYQWKLFKLEQLDSANGRTFSRDRFFAETGWTGEWLRGEWILDAGCGAGRFLEVASAHGCEVVGLDLSGAVDAAAATMRGRPNVHLVQASLYELPFKRGAFDACYCIGVVQHTPEPAKALRSLPAVLKPGGRLAVTLYERKPWTRLNGKYLLRPLTRRMNQRALMAVLEALMPVLFPLTDLLFRVPLLGRILSFVIPVASYSDHRGLSYGRRYRCVLLDTFDMLSPRFDEPQTQRAAEAALAAAGVRDIQRQSRAGLNLVGRRS